MQGVEGECGVYAGCVCPTLATPALVPALIVHSHYVDPPERRYRRLDDASGRIRRRDVRRHRHRPPARRADAAGDGLGGAGIEVACDDGGAVRGQQEGRGLADALSGTCKSAGSSVLHQS